MGQPGRSGSLCNELSILSRSSTHTVFRHCVHNALQSSSLGHHRGNVKKTRRLHERLGTRVSNCAEEKSGHQKGPSHHCWGNAEAYMWSLGQGRAEDIEPNAGVNMLRKARIVICRRYMGCMQGSVAGCMDLTCWQTWYGDPGWQVGDILTAVVQSANHFWLTACWTPFPQDPQVCFQWWIRVPEGLGGGGGGQN